MNKGENPEIRTEQITNTAQTTGEHRYVVLDGLRGVAALVVICYHICEGFATSSMDQMINHGYLAVDFFFMLSGFVIGHAYDRRMNDRSLSIKGFLRRRLFRLHPMLLLGILLGLIAFIIQGCVKWDGTPVDWHWIGLATLLSVFFLPAYPGAGYEIRGNGELFPLNGPAWSLFFEYIGSILYAVLLCRLSVRRLAIIVMLSAIGLTLFAVGNLSGGYHLGVGWSLGEWNFAGGMLRLGFGFGMGLLMARVYKPRHIRGAFWICTGLIVLLLSVPFMGNIESGNGWINGIYDSAVVILVFPALLYIGASGRTTPGRAHRACDMVGRLSYPLYIVHYPLMYLFYAWLWENELRFTDAWPVAICVVTVSILIAWLALRYYDEPVRGYLTRRWSAKSKSE